MLELASMWRVQGLLAKTSRRLQSPGPGVPGPGTSAPKTQSNDGVFLDHLI
jgi:hypothetical protein